MERSEEMGKRGNNLRLILGPLEIFFDSQVKVSPKSSQTADTRETLILLLVVTKISQP